MAVYVDQPLWRLGRMHMCHMMADSTAELIDMALRLGLRKDWIQKPGEPGEHFDISKGKRAEAIRLGAREVSSRDLVTIVRRRRGS
jgi:hypothetical protein